MSILSHIVGERFLGAFWDGAKYWKSIACGMGATYTAIYAASACIQHRSVRRRYRYAFLTTLLAVAAKTMSKQDSVENLKESVEMHEANARWMYDILVAFQKLLQKGEGTQGTLHALLQQFDERSDSLSDKFKEILNMLHEIANGGEIEEKILELKEVTAQMGTVQTRFQAIETVFTGHVRTDMQNTLELKGFRQQLQEQIDQLEQIMGSVENQT
jgi:uncharacterized phage infection (PIP) family protein YhgE